MIFLLVREVPSSPLLLQLNTDSIGMVTGHDMAWHGMVWHGMAWWNIVRCWCDVVVAPHSTQFQHKSIPFPTTSMELNGMLVVVSSVTEYGNNELGDAIDCVIK